MIGRFGTWAFLFSLTVSVVLLPAHLKKVRRALAGVPKTPALSIDASASSDTAALSKYVFKDSRISEQDLNALDAESREILSSARTDLHVYTNPMADKINRSMQSGANVLLSGPRAWVEPWVSRLRKNKARIAYLLRAFLGVLLGVAGAMLLLGQTGGGRALASLCLSLSQKWLILLSLAAGGTFLLNRGGAFLQVPPSLWTDPAAAVLGSALLLRWVDMNHPFWNTALTGLSCPLACGALVLGWDVAKKLFI